MTVKTAYEILLKRCPKFKAIKCVEYSSCFVFQVIPEGFDELGDSANKLMNTLISVMKTDGSVSNFIPLQMPRDEYISGKEVKNFK